MADNANQRSLRQKLLDKKLWVCFAAEFLGTCVFVFMVCGATVTWTPNPGHVLHIALTVGLSVATLASCIGHITGGQINPAVTLGLMVSRRLRLLDGVVIICSQILGGILGASLFYGLTVSDNSGSFGVTVPASSINLGQAVGMEAFLTFILVFTIHSVTDAKKLKGCSEYGAPIIIGFCVFICHMIGVYWVGPIVGAVPGALLYEKVFSVNKNEVTPSAASRRDEEGL